MRVTIYVHVMELVLASSKSKMSLKLTAASATLFDWRTGIDFDVRLVVGWAWGGSHSVLDLSSHRHKCLLYVRSILCTSLQEWDA